MLYLSVSADTRKIEESRCNFFLCRNCKLLGTMIGRKLTAWQRDSFIERYAVDTYARVFGGAVKTEGSLFVLSKAILTD